jgi:hypothetical protein
LPRKQDGEKRPRRGGQKKNGGASTSTQALTLVAHPVGFATPATSTNLSASDWCLYSGSFCYCTNDMNDFVDNRYVTVDSGVMVGDGRILKGHALGNVKLPQIACGW